MATLTDLAPPRPLLDRSAVGRDLATRIRGRSDVEHLRRLISTDGTPEDAAAALAWLADELRTACSEAWGPSPWRAKDVPGLRVASDLLALRCALQRIGPAVADPAHEPIPDQPELKIPCPPGLAYLPFQVEGVVFAAARRHALIADEPGLGKTIQAAGLINATEPEGRIVVVSPATLKINWQRELATWLVTPRECAISYGSDLPDAPIVVIGYSTVHRHVVTLIERGIDLLVLDEAHAIKTATSARTKACTALIRAAKRGVYLSGTPLLNRPVELEPLLKAVGSPIAVNYQRRYCAARMKDVYAGGHGQKRRVWDASGASNLDELRERLRSEFMIRRLKADVLTELPAKTRRILALADVAGADKIAARAAELLHEVDLEAIISGERPVPMDASALALARHEEALAKLPVAMDYTHELLEDEGVPKLVIFAHHRDVLEGIVAALADFGPVLLYGGMADAAKQAAVDRFQTDPACRVFVGGILAAGVGIALTAASRVLMVEVDWVPANVTQAEDRCHRKGQHDAVLVEHLVVPGGIDERICRATVRKQAVLDRALDGAA